MAGDNELLGYIRNDIQEIKRDIAAIRDNGKSYMLKEDCANIAGKCDSRLANFVTKAEFNPVKYCVFSLVMVILAQVARLIMEGGVK